MDMLSIGLSIVAILISGLTVYWSRRAVAANREIERIRAERRASGPIQQEGRP